MAEILITGIELSKEGYTEIRLYDDGSVLYKAKDNIYQDYADIQFKDAKSQELPLHGELKNTTHIINELEKQLEIEKRAETPFSECPPGNALMRRSRIDVLEWVIRNIEAQPTVIEASEETE